MNIMKQVTSMVKELTGKRMITILPTPEQRGVKVFIDKTTKLPKIWGAKSTLVEAPIKLEVIGLDLLKSLENENMDTIDYLLHTLKQIVDCYQPAEEMQPWYSREGEAIEGSDKYDDHWADDTINNDAAFENWRSRNFNYKQAIQDIIDNKELSDIPEVFNELNLDELSSDVSLHINDLINKGIVLVSADSCIEKHYKREYDLIPYSPKWHKPVKLLAGQYIRPESLYTFLREPLMRLQENLGAIIERWDDAPFKIKSIIDIITGAELEAINGRELKKLHNQVYGIRKALSVLFSDLVRVESTTHSNDQMLSQQVIDNSIVINPVESLDQALREYLEITIDEIRIYDDLSRSLILNPIIFTDNDEVAKTISKYPFVRWVTYDRTSLKPKVLPKDTNKGVKVSDDNSWDVELV